MLVDFVISGKRYVFDLRDGCNRININASGDRPLVSGNSVELPVSRKINANLLKEEDFVEKES